MVRISKFEDDFLLLTLRIDKHIKGYVDFYYGPEKLRQIVDNEPITSPSKLLKDSIVLVEQLGTQGYDKERERYLEKLLIAMKTSIEILNGAEISVNDQFLKLYDVALQPVNESELKNLKREYEDAYEGTGSLEERIDQLRIKRRVLRKKFSNILKELFKLQRNELRSCF